MSEPAHRWPSGGPFQSPPNGRFSPAPAELLSLPAGAVLLLVLAAGLATGLVAAAADGQDPRQAVQMELAGHDDTETKLGYGNCQWLYPHDRAQEKLIEEPAYNTDKPIYYAAGYGDAKDKVYTFVLDESQGPGNGYDVVYVDADNNNRIHAEEERFSFQLGTTRKTVPLRIEILVAAGGVTAPYFVNFTAFPYTGDKHPIEKIHANLRNSSYYGGQAVFHGLRRRIAVADLNSNGLFNDVEQGLFRGDRFFLDLNLDGKLQNQSNLEEAFPYGKYTRIEGDWYSILASPDGSQVEIALADPPLGSVEAPPRICKAFLLSRTQPLSLELAHGADQAVAGTYRISHVRLLADGEPHKGWALSGTFGDDGPKVTVHQGRTTRLVVGSPLEVTAQAVPKDDQGTLEFSLSIAGIGGEKYRWRQKDSSSAKAGFEILDSSGKQIAAEEFDYG